MALGLFVAGICGCGEGPSDVSVAEKIKAAKDSAALTAKGDQNKEENYPVPSATGPWPKAVVMGPVFMFGTMRVGDDKSHDFVIKNEGDADLILKTGKTTCKCTRFLHERSQEYDPETGSGGGRRNALRRTAWHLGCWGYL
jgi:hypothetical protein